MGKASISIAVTGSYNGAALERAEKRLDSLSKKAVTAGGNLDTAGAKLVNSGSRLAKAGGEIYNTGSKIEAVGNKMMPVTAAIAGVAVATGSAAIKIDTSLTGVRKTVDGTEQQYQQLKESAIEFSKTNAVSADQILDIQALGAQLGFSIDELDEFSRVVSGLDIATDMNAEQAATELAQFANIVKMSHSDVSRYGSAIVNLGNNLATTESSVSAMGQRIAAASNQVGMSTPDILGWSGAMSSLGIEAEAGGTAFSTTVASIDKAVALGGDSLDAFAKIAGMSAEEFKTSWKNSATDTMIALLKGTNSAENMTVALEDMGVTGIRQTDVLKRLAGNTDLVSQALAVSNQGWQENTALQNEVNNRNDSMAAKLEILQNKVVAVAEDVGTPLVNALTDAIDAAEPLFDAVENVTQGFADMDEGSQRNVIALGAVVAAAGPFLSVTGKIVKTTGNAVTAVGKAKQEWGVYTDALSTSNAASLKTYSQNEKLNKVLEKNPAAKAAGGVDKYVTAVQNANRDTSQYNRAVQNLTKEQQKGSKANEELVANLKNEVVQKRNAMNTSTSLVNGYKQEAAAATSSTGATKAHAAGLMALSTAANVAKVAIATIAPMAIIAGLTALAGAIETNVTRSNNLKEATDGLTGASHGATNAVQEEKSAFDLFSGSAQSARDDVDKVLESQAQLANSMRDTNTNANAQSNQLRDAYNTIKQYANQSDLSTEAQGKLRAAIDTVNSMCGTQISVTDAANGKLSDENGAIDNVTSALGKYIDKKLEQIRTDAQQENLTALYKQQADDIQAVAKAQQEYNGKLKDHDTYVDEYMKSCQGVSGVTREMADAAYEGYKAELAQSTGLTDAKSALDSCNSSINNVSTSLGASSAAAEGATMSISGLAQASPVVSAAMQGIGGDISQFSNDLADAGVSVETFKSLNDTQLIQLVSSWDGTVDSITGTLDGMGVDMSDKGAAAVNALAAGMSSGRVNVDASTEIIKAAASGDWSGVVQKMRDNGIDIPDSVAQGITAEGFAPSQATSAMMSAIALNLTGGDVKAAAELLGHDIDQGLADAIKNNDTDVLTNTYQMTQETIDKAREGFDSHSPSRVFDSIGQDVDSGLAQGIDGGSDGPLSSIGNLVAQVIGATDNMPGDMQNRGSESSGNLASGLAAGLGSVLGSAKALAQNAANGTSSTPGTLSGTGQSAGSGFASGLGQYAGSARASGSSLASNAQGGASGSVGAMRGTGQSAGSGYASGVGSAAGQASGSGSRLASSAQGGASGWNAYTSGSHLGNQFASGIGSAWNAVKNFASSLVNAAKSVMGFSVPEDGPWSGAEKGGETSGRHLGENFAHGMLLAQADVRDSAKRLMATAQLDGNASFGAGGVPSGGKTTVVNNYYSLGDVKIDASSISEFMTINDFFQTVRRAKAAM